MRASAFTFGFALALPFADFAAARGFGAPEDAPCCCWRCLAGLYVCRAERVRLACELEAGAGATDGFVTWR